MTKNYSHIYFASCPNCSEIFTSKKGIAPTTRCPHCRKIQAKIVRSRISKKYLKKTRGFKTCIVCGVQVTQGSRKFCREHLPPKKIKKEHRCVVCDKLLKSRKKYCDEHKPKKLGMGGKHLTPTGSCAVCGKEVFYPGQKTCKGKCRKKYEKIKYKGVRKAAKVLKKKENYQGINKLFLKEVAIFYNNRPEGFDVDHIIPLNNKNVCGLHIPVNLQYLECELNQQVKKAKFDGTYENDSWRLLIK